MADQVIAVLGATGAQGGGVVDALLKGGRYRVRAAVRNPVTDAARLLAKRGVELVKADILDIGSVGPVFKGAYGVFLVTNFWDRAQMRSETAIGTALVKAAHAVGVYHAIWSTLPDCEKLSGGRFKVPHFSGKARVDAAVEAAGFPRYTFGMALYADRLTGTAELRLWLDWLERIEELKSVEDDPAADLDLYKKENRLATELLKHAKDLFPTDECASLVLYASACEISEAADVRTVSDISERMPRAQAIAQLAKHSSFDEYAETPKVSAWSRFKAGLFRAPKT